MQDFNFYNPTKILFGQGKIAAISNEIPPGSRVLITYGGGSAKRNGVIDKVKAALEGYKIFEFGGIEANPTYEKLVEVIDLVRDNSIDFLLAVGGGSVIDGTKFISAAAFYQGDPWEIAENRAANITKALPIGTVLTIPATGSEMNDGAVVTKASIKAKLAFGSPLFYPRFSVLDPTITYTLPPAQISNGVVDAFVHVAEQYLTYPADAKLQDRIAEGIMLTLIEEGPKALIESDNYNVRANIMWCATLALNGLLAAGAPKDWSTHMVGHELTALYGLDHAKTLAIILPSMLTIRKQEKWGKLLQYAERVWQITAGDEEARIDEAIAKTREFFERMHIKTHLSDYDISLTDIPLIIAQLKEHGMANLGEHKNVTPEIVQKVLEASL